MATSQSTADARARFLRKLEQVQSNAELKSLLCECPSSTAIGHQFYANLVFFIEHLVPPRSADMSETLLYIKLSERLRSRDEADQDTRAQTVAAFKAADRVRR